MKSASAVPDTKSASAVPDLKSASTVPDTKSASTVPDTKSASAIPDTKSASAVIVIKGQEDTDIPDPFPFPNHYRSDIEAGLTLQSMPPLAMAKFLTRIASVMLLYKRCPSDEDYERVASEIVARYPFMLSPIEGTVSLISM